MTDSIRTIAFIGAGNMTRSIIGGLINSNYPADKIIATNRSTGKLESLKADFNVVTSNDNIEAAKVADVIVLAVKPQMMEGLLNQLADSGLDLANKLFISIAAGIQTPRLQTMLKSSSEHAYKIIRTMPNTPSLLSLGLTGLYAPSNIEQADKDFAEQMMNAVGKSVWVETEAGIDNITAAAGSAPAYFFLFMESIETEALKLGFSKQQAREIVQQVALGSAQMVCHNPDVSISELRARVTSKGGTTAEAVRVYQEHDLNLISHNAMQAAIKRAQEMASQI